MLKKSLRYFKTYFLSIVALLVYFIVNDRNVNSYNLNEDNMVLCWRIYSIECRSEHCYQMLRCYVDDVLYTQIKL